MNNDIDVVNEDPLLRPIAFHMPGPLAFGFQALEHAVRDGLDLPAGGAAQDDEVIGGRAQLPQINDDYIFGFLLEREPAAGPRKCLRC